MKTTLDLPDDLVKQVKLHALDQGQKLKEAVADLLRKGLAAAVIGSPTVVKADKSMLARRKALTRKFVTGQWGVELADFEATQETDRKAAAGRAKAWRK